MVALYTAEQRKKRNNTIWTSVQGILAVVQFVVFLASLTLVIRFLITGEGEAIAHISIIIKTFFLYSIMITGAIWEKVVFGQWLFAPAFYWEDIFSMLVLLLHSIYLIGFLVGWGSGQILIWIALAGYAAYVINAAQFLFKLRRARLDEKNQ